MQRATVERIILLFFHTGVRVESLFLLFARSTGFSIAEDAREFRKSWGALCITKRNNRPKAEQFVY